MTIEKHDLLMFEDILSKAEDEEDLRILREKVLKYASVDSVDIFTFSVQQKKE